MSDFQTNLQTTPRLAAFGGAGVNQHFTMIRTFLRVSAMRVSETGRIWLNSLPFGLQTISHPQPSEGGV
jgi:hypothetical protein